MTSEISDEDSQFSSADQDPSPTHQNSKNRTRKNSELNQDQFKRFKENCKLRCINRKIILSDLLLGPKTAFEIKRIISENPDISQIRLGKNKLGDEGIKHIASFLESSNQNVESEINSEEIFEKQDGYQYSEIVHLDVSQN